MYDIYIDVLPSNNTFNSSFRFQIQEVGKSKSDSCL